MKNFIVVEIEDNLITSFKSYETIEEAEIGFVKLAADKIWNFNEYDSDDIQEMLDKKSATIGESTISIVDTDEI